MRGKVNTQRAAPGKYQEKIFEELKELEEQKTREALEQKRLELIKLEGERERVRMLQGLVLSRAVGHWSEARDNSSSSFMFVFLVHRY